jgi:hypothetical protein
MSGASAASAEITDATAASAATAATGGATGETGGASAASGGASAATGGVSIPNYTDLLSKMEYGDNTTDTNKLNAIISANPSLFELPADAIDKYALNCSISAPVNFLYLSTIRGGRKMSSEASVGGGCGGGCGCGIKGGGSCEYTGGCFTCKKGVKNITLIYSGIHIIIPKLYNKYHAEKAAKAAKKQVRTASVAKTAKAAKAAKAAKKQVRTA